MISFIEGEFSYVTVLKLNRGYYHIKQDADVQKLCMIIFTGGKYKYQLFPIEIYATFNVFQNFKSKLTHDKDNHQTKLVMALARISSAGMTINTSKLRSIKEQIGYPGYWITRKESSQSKVRHNLLQSL
jgi:hypothetical protein